MGVLFSAKLMQELSNEGLVHTAVLLALIILSHRCLQHHVHVKNLRAA